MRSAVDDLCWLLSRGYSAPAAEKIVGNRYRLRDRQRRALQRVAAGAREVERRRQKEVAPEALKEQALVVDGYNVLLTVETALSGGVLLRGCDGTVRDLSTLGSHYRRRTVTESAIELIVAYLSRIEPAEVLWYFDRPVSNSGRLAALVDGQLKTHRAHWSARAVHGVDQRLIASEAVVATADSRILDRCRRWFNLAHWVLLAHPPESAILDFTRSSR